VVDPFAGLQLQTGAALHRDHTRTPVTEDVARSNFATLGLPPERFRLITGYSGDADVQAQVADRGYAVVVIDGDHSEEGVLADLWWVEQIVAPGAVVVMDDYGDRLWPGVERAVQRYLGTGGRLRLVGSAASSAFLRAPAADA
jgi:cephalosporin hydroxylase